MGGLRPLAQLVGDRTVVPFILPAGPGPVLLGGQDPPGALKTAVQLTSSPAAQRRPALRRRRAAATENWNAYPLHPGRMFTLGGPAAAFPAQTSAARVGNTLNLGLTPFSDNRTATPAPDSTARQRGDHRHLPGGPGRQADRARQPLNGIPGIKLSRPAVDDPVHAERRTGQQLLPLSPASQHHLDLALGPDAAARVPRAWYCSCQVHTATGSSASARSSR